MPRKNPRPAEKKRRARLKAKMAGKAANARRSYYRPRQGLAAADFAELEMRILAAAATRLLSEPALHNEPRGPVRLAP